ncbi:hypothetical protein EVAR_40786_1 [Eumeta japonica]|uniref:Uncharacterized protein n=1 Tax=Eumeta variegata TaxID=151549 RepID=A0A4C1X6N8_EUMVA|nr:hypothetical protein EVAR_40786_1 [Eumeta japonica]
MLSRLTLEPVRAVMKGPTDAPLQPARGRSRAPLHPRNRGAGKWTCFRFTARRTNIILDFQPNLSASARRARAAAGRSINRWIRGSFASRNRPKIDRMKGALSCAVLAALALVTAGESVEGTASLILLGTRSVHYAPGIVYRWAGSCPILTSGSNGPVLLFCAKL